jgi:hypothetical protein
LSQQPNANRTSDYVLIKASFVYCIHWRNAYVALVNCNATPRGATAMTKRDRIELDRITAAAAAEPYWAAATLAAMHRMAATNKDAKAFEALAVTLSLPVQYVNGCMVTR